MQVDFAAHKCGKSTQIKPENTDVYLQGPTEQESDCFLVFILV